MNKILNDETGFTLVEVIISIAVLALICVITLRLMVLAKDVTEDAQISDQAHIIATNAIETCRSQSVPIETKEYYDKDWNRLISENRIIPNEAVYSLTLTLTDSDQTIVQGTTIGKDEDSPKIFHVVKDILVTVTNIEENEVLETIQTSQYFVYKE